MKKARFSWKEHGASLIEYALLAALLACIGSASVNLFMEDVGRGFKKTGHMIQLPACRFNGSNDQCDSGSSSSDGNDG